MGRITLELVRKCAEHNEGELSTLEEISLHQRDIERIEHLHRWCPRLRILLLQGNLISKIENMSRLRDLEYLNLALNNIEVVEGLERCESLTKLDFTANFIADLTSLATLQDLPNLRELYLTGNPCTSYRGYRSWVICALSGLAELDGTVITRSQRLKALQELVHADSTIRMDQQIAIEKRAKEKEKFEEEQKKLENHNHEKYKEDEEWWNSSSEHTPESRLALHRELEERRKREDQNKTNNKKKKDRPVRLFTTDGRPLNVNSAKVQFQITDDEENNSIVLEVHTYRYIDSSLVNCDVEPWYVRVSVKEKILQLVLLEEVSPGQATAKRSNITGHMVITMPKVLPPKMTYSNRPFERRIISLGKNKIPVETANDDTREPKSDKSPTGEEEEEIQSHYLEIGEEKKTSDLDYSRIVKKEEEEEDPAAAAGKKRSSLGGHFFPPNRGRGEQPHHKPPEDRPNSPGFVDNASVPPLE